MRDQGDENQKTEDSRCAAARHCTVKRAAKASRCFTPGNPLVENSPSLYP